MATLQESVVNQLKADIERGVYVLGERLPPMRELVTLFGVSEITVRAALRELVNLGLVERRPKSGVFVTEPTQKLVMERSAGEKVTLACVLPSIHNIFFAQILSGVEEECTRAGYRLLAVSTRGDVEEESRQLRELAKEVNGLVICPLENGYHSAYLELLDAGVPFVFVDRRLESLAVPLVGSDDEAGGYEVTRHLIQTGRKRIWFMSHPLHQITSIDSRLQGYKRALAEANIAFDNKLVSHAEGRDDLVGYQLASQLLQTERFDDPIGIFAVNDGIARGAYMALKEAGRTIPGDAALVSFGDTVASHLEPPLTSIDQALSTIGSEAMRLLIELHKGGKDAQRQHRNSTIKIPVHLTVRSSSDTANTFCPIGQFRNSLPDFHSVPIAALAAGK